MGKTAIDISDWLAKYKIHSVKPSTYDRMITALETMKRYPIADVYTDRLSANDIQQYVNQLCVDGYALTTIKKQFNLLTGYLRWCVCEGILTRPIWQSVKLPTQSTVKKPQKEVSAYSREEQERLKRVLSTGEYPGYFAALAMMEIGCRVGEALALTWNDIDWMRKSIRINKTFVRLGNRRRQYVQPSAKSFCSNRTIPLSSAILRLLSNMDKKGDLIFCNDDGSSLSYEAMRYQIQRACERAHVPYSGQHIFRHTFATNCYNRGCDVKILSKLLGHADVSVTYNTYIHLYGDALEEMRKVVG